MLVLLFELGKSGLIFLVLGLIGLFDFPHLLVIASEFFFGLVER